MSRPPTVIIAVLSQYERQGWHHPSISEFLYSLRLNNDYGTGYCPVHNFQPAAAARNIICKFFKNDTDADWICMIDNDMEIPLNLLDTIKDAPVDAEVIAPAFYLWDQNTPSVKLCMGIDKKDVEITTRNGKDYIDFSSVPTFVPTFKLGTGVMSIRRSLFDKLPYPWFKYRYNEDQGMDGTEDIWFTDQCHAAGIKMYGNMKIGVGHYHNVNLKVLADFVYKNMLPIDRQRQRSINSEQTKDSPSEFAASVSPT